MNKLILPTGARPMKLALPPDAIRLESGQTMLRREHDSHLVQVRNHQEFQSVPRGSIGPMVMAIWDQVTPVKDKDGKSSYIAVNKGLVILMSYTRERVTDRDILHLSVNLRGSTLDWETFRAIRYGFFPQDIDVIQVFPKRDQYMNHHPFVWHLWEAPYEWDPEVV